MAEKWAVHVFNLGLRCKTIKSIQVKGSKATLRTILLKGFCLKHKYFDFNRTELHRNDTRVLFEMQSRDYKTPTGAADTCCHPENILSLSVLRTSVTNPGFEATDSNLHTYFRILGTFTCHYYHITNSFKGVSLTLSTEFRIGESHLSSNVREQT